MAHESKPASAEKPSRQLRLHESLPNRIAGIRCQSLPLCVSSGIGTLLHRLRSNGNSHALPSADVVQGVKELARAGWRVHAVFDGAPIQRALLEDANRVVIRSDTCES